MQSTTFSQKKNKLRIFFFNSNFECKEITSESQLHWAKMKYLRKNQMTIKTHDKEKQNNNVGQDYGLQKPTKRVWFTNLFLGLINFPILTYFYMKRDISFSATGWLPLPENIHWYLIFLGLMALRMLIIFLIHRLTEYIKSFSFWTEKEKKNALYILAVINLLTFPINLPLIGSWIAYQKGNEVLSHNWFLGTFRRILNENEREKLYQAAVQNFFETIDISKDVKNQLQNWVSQNTKSMLEKYDAGSGFATDYISKNLALQKDVFQNEERKKLIQIGNFGEKTTQEEQGLFPWIFEKTINGFNYFNPLVSDYKTCLTAWGFLIGTVIVTGLAVWSIAKSNSTSLKASIETNKDLKTLAEATKTQANLTQKAINVYTEGLRTQDLKIDTNQIKTDKVITEAVNKLEYHQKLITDLSDLVNLNKKLTVETQAQVEELQNICERELRIPVSLRQNTANIQPKFTPEKKEEFLTNIVQKYGNQPLTMKTLKEILNDLLTQFTNC